MTATVGLWCGSPPGEAAATLPPDVEVPAPVEPFDPDDALFYPGGYVAGNVPSGLVTHENADGVPDKWTGQQSGDPARAQVVNGASIPGLGQAWCPAEFAYRIERRPADALAASGHRTELTRNNDVAADDFLVAGLTVYQVVSYYFPTDWEFDASKWLAINQYKGRVNQPSGSGSPPQGIYVEGTTLRLLSHTGAPNRTLGAVTPGTWLRLVIGTHLQRNNTGWVKAWMNGSLVIPQTAQQTMYGGTGQNNDTSLYPKAGIYRTSSWATAGITHVLHLGGVLWTTDEADALAFAGF